MPHSSHKKKQARRKRQEVVGDDGWTRVTSNKPIAAPPSDFHQRVEEAPEGLTQSEILAKYSDIEKKWKASESWKTIENTLKTLILGPSTRIDACVLFGSGTFTGLGQGWINRAHVAMYQLAAFKAVVDLMELVPEHCTGRRPAAFAQEPLYNTQDLALLSTLNIQRVEDPKGFCLLTNRSFAFCPGAEQGVLLKTLSTDPFLYLGGKLDSYIGALGYLQSNTIGVHYQVYNAEGTIRNGPEYWSLEEIEGLKEEAFDDKDVRLDEAWIRDQRARQEPDVRTIESYLRNKEVAKVPDLDVQDYPVYGTCLYWPREGR